MARRLLLHHSVLGSIVVQKKKERMGRTHWHTQLHRLHRASGSRISMCEVAVLKVKTDSSKQECEAVSR